MTPPLHRHPGLVAYLAGNLVSITGTWGQRVVVFWLAWDLTGSPSVIGTLAALDLLPSVLLAPLAGGLADRRPAFRLTRNVQALSAVPSLLMAMFLVQSDPQLPVLMLLSLTMGVLNGFDHPLRLWLVGRIAPPEQMSGAVAANSIVFNVGRMIGPALGGCAISLDLPSAIFAYNGVTFLLFAGVIAWLSPRQPSNGASERSRGAATFAGPRAMLSSVSGANLGVFGLFASVAAMIRPIFELLPSFTESAAGEPIDPSAVFSLLTSLLGLGAMVGAAVAFVLLPRMPNAFFATAAALVAAVATLGFSLGESVWISGAGLTVISGAVLANGIATQVELQTGAAEEVRGRVLALYTMTFRGLPALGAFALGMLGEYVSLRAIFAVLGLVVFTIAMVLLKALRLQEKTRSRSLP